MTAIKDALEMGTYQHTGISEVKECPLCKGKGGRTHGAINVEINGQAMEVEPYYESCRPCGGWGRLQIKPLVTSPETAAENLAFAKSLNRNRYDTQNY